LNADAVTPRKTRLPAEARSLWYASAGNSLALWMLQIAVAVHVLESHTVATLAVVGLAGSLPALVCTPVAGLVADRYDVRRIALLAIGGQVVVLLLVVVVGGFGLGLLAALYAVQGVLASFWPPARQRWLYGLVPVDLRHRANASIGSINGMMTLVGATLGGLLSSWNAFAAFGVAAACQVVATTQLLRTRGPEPTIRAVDSRTSFAADLRNGVRAARDFPLARSVVWIGIAWGLVGGGYSVLLAGHVTVDLGASAFVLGVVYAADGISVMAATVLAGRLSRRHHLAVYASAYVVQGAAWALIFVSDHVAPLLACVVLMRFASGFIIALDTGILLDTVPDHVRGRVTSVHMTTYNGVGRLSLAGLGALLTVVGVTTVGIVAGISSTVFGIVWWLWSGRRAKHAYVAADTKETA
jgi:MFS family permease